MYVLDYDQPRCETCRWWMTDGSGPGECHRYPPMAGGQLRPNANGHGMDWIVSVLPETSPKHFCGEHSCSPATI